MLSVFEGASNLTLRYVNCWLLWGYTIWSRHWSSFGADPPLPWGIVVWSAYGDAVAISNPLKRSRWTNLWLKNKNNNRGQNKPTSISLDKRTVLPRVRLRGQ